MVFGYTSDSNLHYYDIQYANSLQDTSATLTTTASSQGSDAFTTGELCRHQYTYIYSIYPVTIQLKLDVCEGCLHAPLVENPYKNCMSYTLSTMEN